MHWSRWVFAATMLTAAAGGVDVVRASQPDVNPDTTARTQTGEADSPRATVAEYLDRARAGQFGQAARYLDLPDSLRSEGARIARQLKAVLDRHAWIDLEAISATAAGDTTDGLPRSIEQIALIPSPGGTQSPIRLYRHPSEEPRWRFSQSTVARVEGWYDRLPNRWAMDKLPSVLVRPGPFDILWWQWFGLVGIILLAAPLGRTVRRLVLAVLMRIARRTAITWDDIILARLEAPLSLGGFLLVGVALIPFLGLYPPATALLHRLAQGGFLIMIFWSILRLVDVGQQIALQSPWALDSAASRTLVPLGSRVAKVVVTIFAVVSALSLVGYPVASLIAGLGIGGLAFALAAQKTVENLFGTFSIGIDQPFREGDFVKVNEFVGTVEAIGLRSTRFRTLDRTLITIPNSRVADMQLESFAARDRLRLATVIGLVYETTVDQMRAALSGFESVLRGHPKIWPDAVVVRFSAFNESSLDIEIMAWFETRDWGEFQLIRQEILLQMMAVVERAGTSIAFPTRTLHLASAEPGSNQPGVEALAGP